MTTSSDEQYRIQKAITGSNGVKKQDALDEEIDNGIDEEASNIILTFKNNILRKIHNDGNPMSSEDRKNSLTLDGRSKLNKKKKTKGRYGIGGFNSRCCLAGQGEQVMTTKDGEDCYQVKINLKELQDESVCPVDCWTGDHDYRPRWEKVDCLLDYEQGVTKEYNGDNLKIKFDLQELALHMSIKYNKEIKNGINFIINWDNEIYHIPDIYNFEHDIFHIDTYDVDGYPEYYCEYDTTFRCTPRHTKDDFKGDKPPSNSKKGTYKFYIGYPKNYDTDLIIDEQNPSDATIKGHVAKKYINNNTENVFKNIEEVEIGCDENGELKKETTMRLLCGENYIDYDISTSNTKVSNFAESVIEKFLPDIRVNMNGSTLSCPDFNRKIVFASGGDLGAKLVYKIFDIELNYESTEKYIDLSQEDKNKVQIPKHLEKMIGIIIKTKQEEINKNLLKTYKAKEADAKEANQLHPQSGTETDLGSISNLEPDVELDPVVKFGLEPESEFESNIKVEPNTYHIKQSHEDEIKTYTDSDVEPDSESEPEIDPSDVSSYRRGGVAKQEILNQLSRVIGIVDAYEEDKYYKGQYLDLYNKLTKIN